MRCPQRSSPDGPLQWRCPKLAGCAPISLLRRHVSLHLLDFSRLEKATWPAKRSLLIRSMPPRRFSQVRNCPSVTFHFLQTMGRWAVRPILVWIAGRPLRQSLHSNHVPVKQHWRNYRRRSSSRGGDTLIFDFLGRQQFAEEEAWLVTWSYSVVSLHISNTTGGTRGAQSAASECADLCVARRRLTKLKGRS